MVHDSHLRIDGFTLIELSIVMIVVGLLVGGVLIGRDLIRIAEIRATIRQVEEFITAVNAFRSKYNCLPGDCVADVEFGFDAGSAGDGNGVIGGCLTGCYSPGRYASAEHEYVNFWHHLSAAGLIRQAFLSYAQLQVDHPEYFGGTAGPPSGVVTPAAKLRPVARKDSGKMGIVSVANGWMVRGAMTLYPDASGADGTTVIMPSHNLLLGSSWQTGGLTVSNDFHGGFLPADVEAVDRKIDDGLPPSGTMQVYGYPAFSDANTAYYGRGLAAITCDIEQRHCVCGIGIDPPPYHYDVRSQYSTGIQRGCPFAIRASF